jgi:hypothetical protein
MSNSKMLRQLAPLPSASHCLSAHDVLTDYYMVSFLILVTAVRKRTPNCKNKKVVCYLGESFRTKVTGWNITHSTPSSVLPCVNKIFATAHSSSSDSYVMCKGSITVINYTYTVKPHRSSGGVSGCRHIWACLCIYFCRYSLFRHVTRRPIKVKLSRYRSGQALGFPRGWGSRISRQSAHKGRKVGSPTHRPSLPPRRIPGTHFC